ncbi:MAG: hypothetical protein PHF31_14680 [Methylobacter sp.]|nr:hypothetical protein [Methylobacter sp.]
MERAGTVSGCNARVLLILKNRVVLPVIDIGPEGVDRNGKCYRSETQARFVPAIGWAWRLPCPAARHQPREGGFEL